MNRRTSPRVKSGRVQKKNNWLPTERQGRLPRVVRERPDRGYRHLVSARDIGGFVDLLPDWDELSTGLQTVVLSRHDDAMGFHEPGAVRLCAWEAELWWYETVPSFYSDHRDLLDRLSVETEKRGPRLVTKWTEGQARGFQLLHVLLHELGHHHDRMTTRSRRGAARGEAYAEHYARAYGDRIWDTYLDRIGIE